MEITGRCILELATPVAPIRNAEILTLARKGTHDEISVVRKFLTTTIDDKAFCTSFYSVIFETIKKSCKNNLKLDSHNLCVIILIMEYEKTILNLLERVTILEEKMVNIESHNAKGNVKTSKKYSPLSAYLLNSNKKNIELKFSDIENILKFELPASARLHRPFWANSTTHSMALSWLSIGYKTNRVDIDEETVSFEKVQD